MGFGAEIKSRKGKRYWRDIKEYSSTGSIKIWFDS